MPGYILDDMKNLYMSQALCLNSWKTKMSGHSSSFIAQHIFQPAISESEFGHSTVVNGILLDVSGPA